MPGGITEEGRREGFPVPFDDDNCRAGVMSDGTTVITVGYNHVWKDVALQGSPDAIQNAIRSAFHLGDSDFWLEDDSSVVSPLHPHMRPECYGLLLATRGNQRSISVSFGGYTKRINVSASCPEVVEGAIKSVFEIDANQRLWLENEFGVVHGIDKNMPAGNYTLHLARRSYN